MAALRVSLMATSQGVSDDLGAAGHPQLAEAHPATSDGSGKLIASCLIVSLQIGQGDMRDERHPVWRRKIPEQGAQPVDSISVGVFSGVKNPRPPSVA